MAGMSTYLRNAILNATLRNTPYTSPATVYAALYLTDPTADDTGTEVTGGGYVRLAVTFDAPAAGHTQNSADLLWPVATASWGNIGFVGVRDAPAGGNLLFFGPVSTAKQIDAGDQFKIPAGDLDISET